MVTEDDARRICLSLPDTSEVLSAGVPYFRVERRGFAKLRQDPDALVVWTASVADKAALLKAEPEKFFSTSHYDGEPAMLVRLDCVTEDEVTELLTNSWRIKAPELLRKAFDHEIEKARA